MDHPVQSEAGIQPARPDPDLVGRLLREPEGQKDHEGRHGKGEAAAVRAAHSRQHMVRVRGRGGEERQRTAAENSRLSRPEGRGQRSEVERPEAAVECRHVPVAAGGAVCLEDGLLEAHISESADCGKGGEADVQQDAEVRFAAGGNAEAQVSLFGLLQRRGRSGDCVRVQDVSRQAEISAGKSDPSIQ